MFGVFKAEVPGALVWLATTETREEAEELANETMLRDEDCVMVMEVSAFRQQL